MKQSAIAIFLLLCCANAQAVDFATGISAGTPGIGATATVGITRTVNLRGALNWFSYDFDESQDGVDYELELDLQSFGAVLDWHPGGSGFRFSAGAFSNGNEAAGTGRGQPGTFVEFGDAVVPADQLGRVEADIGFDSLAPYVGLGWGNAIDKDGRWTFSLDVGVLLQGEPEVTLVTPDVDPAFAAVVEAERQRAEDELRDEVDSLEFYPYISVGLGFRF